MNTFYVTVLILSLCLELTCVRGVSLELGEDSVPAILLKEPETAVQDMWSNCGTRFDKGTINTLTFTPNPLVKGQNLTVTMNVTLKENITGGKINMFLKLGFVTIFNSTYQLCDVLKMEKTCPMKAGDYEFLLIEEIPSDEPSLNYTGKVVALDQVGNRIVCISLTLHF